MGRVASRHGRARAVIAVLALYGLFLQAFLSGLMPIAPAFGAEGAAICAPGSDAPSPHGDADHSGRHECCTAACLGSASVPPDHAATEVAWARDASARIVWTIAGTIPSTGPPVHAASARGPPSA